jgi:hypothetical protein
MNYAYRLATLCLFFCLTNQFISAQCVSGKKVETFGGDTLVYSCPDDQSDIISFKPYTYSTPFIFVITDDRDTIRRISTSGKLDFNGLNNPEYHVYGYSYKGNIKKVIGQHIGSARITDLCYEQSLNYIVIIREYPLSPVIDAQSFSPVFVCAPDGKADPIKINSTFPSRSLHKYVVVDETSTLVAIYEEPDFDADQLNCKTCKAYAVSYTGDFIGKVGAKINDMLASDCHAVSTNFLTLVRDTPKGGSISLSDDQSSLFICSSSIKNQTIPLVLKNNSAGYVRYIITDTADKVLAIQTNAELPASVLANGICRIWGLTYTGTLFTEGLGKKILNILWSDDCYALTTSYITISKSLPDGGKIAFQGLSASEIIRCLDDKADIVQFESIGEVGPKQLWVLSDTTDHIISWTGVSSIDVNNWPVTTRRMYHLTFTGDTTLQIGQSVSASASDDCYDYSDNYLTILTDVPDPGTITFDDLTMEKFVCINDSAGMLLHIKNLSASRLNLTYVLTDSVGRVIRYQNNQSFNLSSSEKGKYNLYAISYAGALNLEGNQIEAKDLASGCFKVSGQPLKLTVGEARAGSIKFENGKDSILLCSNSNLVSARLTSSTAHLTPFVFVLTNVQDTVIRILKTDTFNLNGSSRGLCKIWGLAYTGELRLKTGDYFPGTLASTGCNERSSNALILIKDRPEGGDIALVNGDTSFLVCYKDGWPDLLNIKKSSSSLLPYQYVATDEQNLIIQLNVGNVNLELLPSQVKKIYGVSYLGLVTAKVGESITEADFASDCYELSRNVIHVNNEEIRAGNIRLEQNLAVLDLCLQSQSVDTFKLSVNGSTAGVSYYFIGIKDDTLRFVSKAGQFTSQDCPEGSTQIFGIAFKGNFLALPGDKISAHRLVDSCYGVSTNSILVRKYQPEAGIINANGNTSFYLCPGDGQADFVSLSAVGAAPLSYAYVVTNAGDSIIAVSTQSIFDLDTFPIGLCKIYGLSYNGLLNGHSKFIQDNNLVNGCFEVTDSFIRVFKAPADGGRLEIFGGDTVINICVEDLAADTIRFNYNSSVALKYALLVTDAQNRLQSVIQDLSGRHDFNGSDPGVCRVYGVSYGGILTAFRNDDITKSKLASGCYDLSDNYVTINKSNTGGLCKNLGVTPENKVFLSVYPNPASDLVKIRLKSKYLTGGRPQLSVSNISGGINKKIILDSQITDNQDIIINTSDLKPGMYFIMFQNGYIFDSIKLTVLK